LRETAWRFAGRKSKFVGSPETVANELERWFSGRACDGFNYRVENPTEFKLFIERVLPILRARGVIRSDYQADTLRGHLGLPFPENRYARARQKAGPSRSVDASAAE